MARGLAVRGASAVVVSAALAAGLATLGVSAPAAAQSDGEDWRPCGATGGTRIDRVEVVLALDRSGSLNTVDPGGTKRRRAVHGTRVGLGDLRDSVSALLADAELDFAIDVSLIAFNASAETIAGFKPVGADHPSEADVNEAINTGGNTDYGPAIREALALFEGSVNEASTSTCRIFVLFTDGTLDPLNTFGGRRPSSERQAEEQARNLLDDVCLPDAGLEQYRQRFNGLNVSTYVAVLRGPGFDRGEGNSHSDRLARASKQVILALTGHEGAPLLGDTSAADGCEAASSDRAGKVIEMDQIDELAAELAKVVGDVWLAVRQPRLRCADEPVGGAAVLEGEWPYVLAVRGPGEGRLCTLTPPLDGVVELTWRTPEVPPKVAWHFDDGAQRYSHRTLAAGEAAFSFDLVSDELEERDYRSGEGGTVVAEEAEVEVIAVWRPAPQPTPSEQPAQIRWSEQVTFGLPDRERAVLDALISCRVHQRAAWSDEPGGVRAQADGLCEVQAPPAGEFEITLVERAEDNRLRWAMTVDDESTAAVPGTPVLRAPGDAPLSLGARSQVLDRRDIPAEVFEDGVRYVLRWRSPAGEVVVDSETLTEAVIEVRPPVVEILECADEPEVIAVLDSSGADPALVVDTGCMLLSRGGGAVGVRTTGDLEGVPWQLVAPRSSDEATWPARDDLLSPASAILQEPSTPDSPLYVAVEHPNLGDFGGEDVEFTLVATPSEQSAALPEPQRATRSVAVYVPFPRCADRVGAVRVDVEAPDGGGFEQRARVQNVCEVSPPPSGLLEVRAEAAAGRIACWGASRRPVGRPACDTALIVEAGEDDVYVSAFSSTLPADLVAADEAILEVKVSWKSANGESQMQPRSVTVAVPEPSLNLIRCDPNTAPRVTNSGEEIPEGPILVDTGCDALAHPAGSLGVAVEGDVAGVEWRIEEPLSVPAGSGGQRILIRSDSPLANDPIRGEFAFELVTWINVDGFEPPPSRVLRDVPFSGVARIRIRCDRSPEVVWDGPEVPEGPLAVDTGCTLLAPRQAGTTIGVTVEGDVAGVRWRLSESPQLVLGDEGRRILIETDGPIPNRRYDGDIDFTLAAVSTYEVGGRPAVEQSVGSEGAALGLNLRARPNVAAAIPIAAGLLVAALVAVWLIVWFWTRRTARLPAPSDLQVRTRSVKFRREGPTGLALTEGATQGLRDAAVKGNRRKLTADGLTLRLRTAPWNLRRLVSGDPAELRAAEGAGRLVAWRCAAGQSSRLTAALRAGVVVLALDPPAGNRPELRGQLWLLRARGSISPEPDAIDSAIDAAARELARKLPKDVQRWQSSKG